MPDILTILQEPDFAKVVSTLCVDTNKERNSKAYKDEYLGKRERRDESVDKREDKTIDVYSDTETETKDGVEVPKKTGTDTIPVAKIHTNFPKRIVRTAVNFLFGGDMSITYSETNDSTEVFSRIFEKKLRMKSVLKKFTRTVMVETKAAILFYPRAAVVVKDGKESKGVEIRLQILSIANSEIYPHFDDFGDMDAFIRKYTGINPEGGKECSYVVIYTADNIITSYNAGGTWVQTAEKNLIGKIPVVYAETEIPEWEDIVTALDKYETRLSRLSDTNDYFAEPILKSYGATNLPSKKTVGKQIEFEMDVDDEGKVTHGDADYLTWQQTIESIKLELDSLRAEILGGTSTPDLTFDNVKGIGALSGIAMKFMFLDAFLKAEDNREIFGPVIERSVSIVREFMVKVTNLEEAGGLEDNDIDVEFGSILPDDLREMMETLSLANGNKPINSQKTITSRSPFTKDVEEETTQMQAEEKQSSSNLGLGGLIQ